MTIRKAIMEDLERIQEIYAAAKQFMDANGNPTQWAGGYPPQNLIQEDIEKGQSYVIEEDGMIHAVFIFFIGDDPTYAKIYEGSWKNDDAYGVIHRVGSDGVCHGIMKACVTFCKKQIGTLRCDTHHDNYPMQHQLEKNGFERCGIIYVENGSPRIAYHLLPT